MSEEVSLKKIKHFGLLIAVCIIVVFGFFLPWKYNIILPILAWVLPVLVLILVFLYPVALRPAYKVWMFTGNALGWINSRIILSLVFYIMILPMGIFMRIFKGDPLNRKLEPLKKSYRINSINNPKEQMEKPF